MKRFKVWLLLALVFVAGFAGGVVATRITVRHFVRDAIANPDMLRNRIQRDLNRNLRLNGKQRERVREILTASQSRLQDLRREFRPQFDVIVEGSSKDISDVLTPEQRERFEKYQAEHRAMLQPR